MRGWNDLQDWFKGGIIGAVLYVLYVVLSFITFFPGLILLLRTHFLLLLLNLILWFLIGTIPGWIIGRWLDSRR